MQFCKYAIRSTIVGSLIAGIWVSTPGSWLNAPSESPSQPIDSTSEGPPRDLDGDELYEDVIGAGEATFDDAVDLAFSSDDPSVTPEYFDFDGDGDVDFVDAIELAFSV